mmetsp:Transcript_22758/g.49874  ORF Transcript_22758/g.49874 Transcript_22758/m.49874 type:complete len:648 (-) Transcript_22758:63-2006(-)|eukprot:CAMPEP_0204322430 /NCGR_PEP_ID=MMETSP0469-20131031/8682_1 /ASSEMBLY_ACC=CAM_ASM_000384 /TAXON_ID=2969 /ORGANISM="Oxyrrhis marina" /LENGTH=647 /DNA_ID=CAMNT_0051303771 /DNA_START=124 /DNA_END=2067 /DNA_ORIENTATION=-
MKIAVAFTVALVSGLDEGAQIRLPAVLPVLPVPSDAEVDHLSSEIAALFTHADLSTLDKPVDNPTEEATAVGKEAPQQSIKTVAVKTPEEAEQKANKAAQAKTVAASNAEQATSSASEATAAAQAASSSQMNAQNSATAAVAAAKTAARQAADFEKSNVEVESGKAGQAGAQKIKEYAAEVGSNKLKAIGAEARGYVRSEIPKAATKAADEGKIRQDASGEQAIKELKGETEKQKRNVDINAQQARMNALSGTDAAADEAIANADQASEASQAKSRAAAQGAATRAEEARKNGTEYAYEHVYEESTNASKAAADKVFSDASERGNQRIRAYAAHEQADAQADVDAVSNQANETMARIADKEAIAHSAAKEQADLAEAARDDAHGNLRAINATRDRSVEAGTEKVSNSSETIFNKFATDLDGHEEEMENYTTNRAHHIVPDIDEKIQAILEKKVGAARKKSRAKQLEAANSMSEAKAAAASARQALKGIEGSMKTARGVHDEVIDLDRRAGNWVRNIGDQTLNLTAQAQGTDQLLRGLTKEQGALGTRADTSIAAAKTASQVAERAAADAGAAASQAESAHNQAKENARNLAVAANTAQAATGSASKASEAAAGASLAQVTSRGRFAWSSWFSGLWHTVSDQFFLRRS